MKVEALVGPCLEALERGDVVAALRNLNGAMPYRYTGIYRFDGRWMKNVWLFDREQPDVHFGSDVLWDDSYCRLTVLDGDALEIANSVRDPRVESHSARMAVQCYIAVALRTADGSLFGTLCLFDTQPRPTPSHAFDALRVVRPYVERAISRGVLMKPALPASA